MKIKLSIPELDVLRQRMRAPKTSWSPTSPNLSPREVLRKELAAGKNIDLQDVEVFDGTLLTYQGEQILLYIKDTRQEKETLLFDKDNARKFHVAECHALERMRREGRFERYVVTTDTSNIFRVDATDRITKITEEIETELRVCKNCLTKLNWNLYKKRGKDEKLKIYSRFSLEEFFAEFSTFFMNRPKQSDLTAGIGGYTEDWSKISKRRKNEENWTCQNCTVNLEDHPKYLHTHHKNGVVSNNKTNNLEVLCIDCHSQQPQHAWIKPDLKTKALLQRLRREQAQTQLRT